MTKELYMDAHDELIGRYMEDHPEATLDEAVEATAMAADDLYKDKLADMIDQARQRKKDEQ